MTANDPFAAHCVAVFEDRLILEARPPITEAQLAEIQALCAGPIPPGLLALWRTSFGGAVDYSLGVTLGDVVHAFAFTELFYPGSDHYRDLFSWIEHEAELAQEAAEARGQAWSGKLSYLPFGGFEYLERLYVCVEPGPDHGAVFAYAQGLPPAWTLRLNQSASARVADDVPALFGLLDLEADPAAPDADPYGAGHDMLAAITAIGETDPDAAARLTALMRSAVVDWRAELEAGRLPGRTRARRLALGHAADTGDIALLARLKAAGCDLDEAFGGGGNVLDHALARGRTDAARWLLDQGVDPANALHNGAGQAPPDLVADLLARGARPTAIGAAAAARQDRMDGAVLIVDALAKADPAAVRGLIDDLARWAQGDQDSAARIEAGTLASNQTPAQCRQNAARLLALRARCQTALGLPPEPPRPEPPAKPSLWRRLMGR